MASDKALKDQLVALLTSGDAHADFDAATRSIPSAAQGKRPKGAEHSPWEVLEHMRIAQRDILDFIRDPKHVSPEFPKGYWPASPVPPNDKAWKKSADAFRTDLSNMVELVEKPSTDLLAPMPHGDGKTILREVLLLADHNAYHLGQLVLIRRLLGTWHPS